MSIYAIIKNNLVENIIVCDSYDDAHELFPESIVSSVDGLAVGIGWKYDGEKFSAPPEAELTHVELVALADAEKQERIAQANEYMNSNQWPGKAVLGRLKGDELAQYNAWLDYLDALEAVDTSSAPDINWPVPPGL